MYSIWYFFMYGLLIMVLLIVFVCLGFILKNISCLKLYINFKGDLMIFIFEGDLLCSILVVVCFILCVEVYELVLYVLKVLLVNVRFLYEKKGVFELWLIKDIKDDYLGVMINVLCVLWG